MQLLPHRLHLFQLVPHSEPENSHQDFNVRRRPLANLLFLSYAHSFPLFTVRFCCCLPGLLPCYLRLSQGICLGFERLHLLFQLLTSAGTERSIRVLKFSLQGVRLRQELSLDAIMQRVQLILVVRRTFHLQLQGSSFFLHCQLPPARLLHHFLHPLLRILGRRYVTSGFLLRLVELFLQRTDLRPQLCFRKPCLLLVCKKVSLQVLGREFCP